MKQAALDLWHLNNRKRQPYMPELVKAWASLTGDNEDDVAQLIIKLLWKHLDPVLYKLPEEEATDSLLTDSITEGLRKRDLLRSEKCSIDMNALFEHCDFIGVSYPEGLKPLKRKAATAQSSPKEKVSNVDNALLDLADQISKDYWSEEQKEVTERLGKARLEDSIRNQYLETKKVKGKAIDVIKGTDIEVSGRMLASLIQVSSPVEGMKKGNKALG